MHCGPAISTCEPPPSPAASGRGGVRWALSAPVLAVALLAGCSTGSSTALRTEPAPAPAAPSVGSVGEADTAVATTEQRFAQWVARFRQTALAAGIDEATLHQGLDPVQLLPRVLELDRAQPEFSRTLWDYLDKAVSPARVAQGREKLQQFAAESGAASTRYGVPAAVLVAVWGIESNYGRNYGDLPVIDALATLGFDGRREAWARGELLAALKILQHGDMDRSRMLGSWAGAMGQTQFMPSVYLAHAVDADGDGRADIWGSLADVLASTAQFIARSGWRRQEAWGTEVALPADFDLARADPSVRQTSAQWAQAGVRSVDGSALPELADASVLQPAGLRGPAFLVGANYRAILRYNNSTSYALSVCLLAQRIGGGPGVQSPWPRELRALSGAEIKRLQAALNQRGFDSGAVDGQVGPATRKALQDFQRSRALPADGYPTVELLQLLQPAP